MLTCPHILDPLEPHFYIVKLGFIGVNINFLLFFSKRKIACNLNEEALMSTHNSCFEKNKKSIILFIPKLSKYHSKSLRHVSVSNIFIVVNIKIVFKSYI